MLFLYIFLLSNMSALIFKLLKYGYGEN